MFHVFGGMHDLIRVHITVVQAKKLALFIHFDLLISKAHLLFIRLNKELSLLLLLLLLPLPILPLPILPLPILLLPILLIPFLLIPFLLPPS